MLSLIVSTVQNWTHHISSMEPPALAGWAAGGRVPWTWGRDPSPPPQSSGLSFLVCFLALKQKQKSHSSLSIPSLSQHRAGTKETRNFQIGTIQMLSGALNCAATRIYLTFQESLDNIVDVYFSLSHGGVGWCERAQSNVTDITSGHSAAADWLTVGPPSRPSCPRDITSPQVFCLSEKARALLTLTTLQAPLYQQKEYPISWRFTYF